MAIKYSGTVNLSIVAEAMEYFDANIETEGHRNVKRGWRLTASRFGAICKTPEVGLDF